jgi:hypothetical protein
VSNSSGDGTPRWLVIVGGIAALLASVATIIGVLLGTGIISNPFATHSFVGSWESTDVFDGSHQTLTISSDGPQVTYHDDKASVACGGRPAQGSGIGSISGTQLTVTLSVSCLAPLEPHGTATYTFTYNVSKDTLSDQFGDVWTRTG